MSTGTTTTSGLRSGLAIALVSAATFGTSGPLGTSLLRLGWTPGAVVLVRVGVAAIVLLVPALVLLRRWRPSRRALTQVACYGVVAVAGAQLCYFSAVQYLSVGVALLLEYLAPVLLIGWTWFRTRRAPRPAVVVGAVVALVGMAGVLDLVGSGATRVSLPGVAWGLAAAVCLACYFVLSEHQDEGESVPALAVVAGGTLVGGLVLAIAGVSQLLPMRFVAGDVLLRGASLPWWVPAGLLVLVATVAAYLTGIVAIRRLGSQRASFVALTEVLFAIVVAAVLLAQTPGPVQLVGGALVLVGILVVQRSKVTVTAPDEEPVPVG